MSESTIEARIAFATAVAELQTQLPKIIKDKTAKIEKKTGGSFSYKFSDLEQVSDAILPMLGKLGLAFISMPTINKDGKFVLDYELMHVAGHTKGGEFPLAQGTPQEVGSHITYARRYCLCAITGLTPGGDDDAAAAQAGARRRASATPQAAQQEPGVNAEQQRQMSTLFQNAPTPVDGKDARLKYVVDTIGREVHSATELTRGEAGKVIAKLESWIEQNEPPAGDA